jgi:hypothetical protein
VQLIHWKPAEAAERVEALKSAGYEVVLEPFEGPPTLRRLRSSPPDALVIDLDRAPSQGRDVAFLLRQSKATRGLPLVFAGGEPEKVARIEEALPDAVFTPWSRIRSGVKRAIAKPPAAPIVPESALAGYSGTPLPKKLGIKPDTVVALLGAPEDFEELLRPLPENVQFRSRAQGRANVILLFARSKAEMARRFPAASRCLVEGGGLWIAWPKKVSGVATDLSQAAVRSFGLDADFVDYKICAIDETWSGLLFARRKPKRTGGS